MIWWDEASICYGAKTGCLGNRSALLVVWSPLFFSLRVVASVAVCVNFCVFSSLAFFIDLKSLGWTPAPSGNLILDVLSPWLTSS